MIREGGYKMKRKGKRGTRGVALQLLLALPLLTFLAALGTAKLMLSEAIGQERAGLCVCIYTAVIAFAACLYCALRLPQKKILWGLLTAVSYLCLLLLSNLLFFGVGYGEILPVAGSVLGAGLVGSVLGAGKRRKYA